MTDWHWLFGDQLGPHFLAPGTGGPTRDSQVVMIEARSVFRRRRFHRAKAHLVLSAMRHRAAELGGRVRYIRAETYREGLYEALGDASVTVHHPTSRAALGLVRSLEQVRLLPARGFLVPQEAFAAWADERGAGRLRQEDFYRWVRHALGLLVDGDSPAGGRWNHDHANRERPPRGASTLGAPEPYRPDEDDTHHIPRLMLLGSHALQRGWDPRQVTDWFHRCFVAGYDWVMLPNVTGMSQYADGGRMTTKPYTSGGAYIHRMSDLCEGCAYRPGDRAGDRACPFTTGYWSFAHRHRDLLAANQRTARAVQGLDRLGNLEEVLATDRRWDEEAP
ncbi:cryptochrome/photolyase family protein [Streptomyces sp. NPDC058420]|uniref:cryptochrome/photolyase family protein n=1 Tax=Streptomyces sp. NPDC058420 TaxID=3346489 RepID=UPI00366009B2